MVCGGTFSDAEFDALEAQKNEISVKKMEARARLTALAWELLAVQKESDVLDKKFDKIHRRQELMIEQEARALDELDTFTGGVSSEPLAMLSDLDFSVDPSWIDFLGDVPPDEIGRAHV